MLFINDEQVQVAELWGKKGFLSKPNKKGKNALTSVFKLSPRHRRKTYDRRRGTHREHSPRTFSILSSYRIVVEGNQVVVRYAKSIRQEKRGGMDYKVYVPDTCASFADKTGFVKVDSSIDPDLLFFLMHDPRNSNSPFMDKRKQANFYLEDKGASAEAKAYQARMSTRAINLLYGDKEALVDKDLRTVAKSYSIPNSDEMSPDELRVELEKHARKNPEKFIQSTSGHNVKIKATVQDAIDMKLIMFDKDRWYTTRKDDSNKPDQVIVDVRFAEDKVERIVSYLTDKDGKMLEHLESLIEEAEEEALKQEISEEV